MVGSSKPFFKNVGSLNPIEALATTINVNEFVILLLKNSSDVS